MLFGSFTSKFIYHRSHLYLPHKIDLIKYFFFFLICINLHLISYPISYIIALSHLIIHDGIHKDSDAVFCQDLKENVSGNNTTTNTSKLLNKMTKTLTHLLRGHIKVLNSEVDFFVNIDAGNDKEHPRTTGTFE